VQHRGAGRPDQPQLATIGQSTIARPHQDPRARPNRRTECGSCPPRTCRGRGRLLPTEPRPASRCCWHRFPQAPPPRARR
jgi:hypothetical protein